MSEEAVLDNYESDGGIDWANLDQYSWAVDPNKREIPFNERVKLPWENFR